MCAFSLPFRVEGALSPDSTDGSRFAERAFVCAVTSNGCLLFYGEENGLSFSSTATEPSQGGVKNTSAGKINAFMPDRSFLNTHPLTIFERLLNLTEDNSEDLVFGGDGLGRYVRNVR